MLLGQYYTKVVSHGRTALPARFRKELGMKIVICRWYEGSLAVFSPRSWETVLEQVLGKALLTRPSRDTERFLLGGAYEAELDNQGRFIIQATLRKHAGLEKEIVFLGLRSRVEVWDKERWQKKEKGISRESEALIEKVQISRA